MVLILIGQEMSINQYANLYMHRIGLSKILASWISGERFNGGVHVPIDLGFCRGPAHIRTAQQ